LLPSPETSRLHGELRGRVRRAHVEDPVDDEAGTSLMTEPGPVGGGGRRGAIIAWVGWWLASAALYLVLVDTVALPELVTGAVIATVAASGATLLRAQRRVVMRPRVRWLAGLWRPVLSYPTDLWTVTRALARREPAPGKLYALPFEPGVDSGRSAARRVLGPTAGSFAPNTIVVGLDSERGLLLVHQLVPSADPVADADPLGLR